MPGRPQRARAVRPREDPDARVVAAWEQESQVYPKTGMSSPGPVLLSSCLMQLWVAALSNQTTPAAPAERAAATFSIRPVGGFRIVAPIITPENLCEELFADGG